jgi:hypothetical protein
VARDTTFVPERIVGRHSTPPWKEIFAGEKGKNLQKINQKSKTSKKVQKYKK